jgi:hypothetical protein
VLIPPPAKPPSMRVFGLIMLIGFGILGGLLLLGWRDDAASWKLVLGLALVVTGATIALWALVSPTTVRPVHDAWMRFGMALGTVVSAILLGVVYFVVLTPTGWLMRRTGTDPLARAIQRGPGTYWGRHAPRGGPQSSGHMS